MLWTHLVDDAAVLPPGDLPLELAVKEHREHLAAPYADLVGSLVVPDTKLADLRPLAEPEEPLRLHLLVTGGAGAIEPAVRWAQADGLELARVRIMLRDGAGTGDDLARNAQRVAVMVEHCGIEAPVHVEVPRTFEQSWLTALDEVAMAGLGLALRADDDLALGVDAALDRETPFLVVGGSVTATFDVVAAALQTADWEQTRRWLTAIALPDVIEAHEELAGAGRW